MSYDVRFRACARRAWASSMKLVAECANLAVHSLEALYRVEAGSDAFAGDVADAVDACLQDREETVETLEAELAEMAAETSEKNELESVLKHIHEIASEAAKDEDLVEDLVREDPDTRMPDGDDLVHLADSKSDQDMAMNLKNLPRTLAQALLLSYAQFKRLIHFDSLYLCLIDFDCVCGILMKFVIVCSFLRFLQHFEIF